MALSPSKRSLAITYRYDELGMDPTGLALGILALAGLFNNAIDCFEYVRISRTFDKDFTTAQLLLDDTQLRLSRWGKAVGFSGNIRDGDIRSCEAAMASFGSQQDVQKVEVRLNQILDLFNNAESVSKKFRSDSDRTNKDLQNYDPQGDLKPDVKMLHDTVHGLSLARRNKTSIRKRVLWALYEEKQLKRLLEGINDLVSGLIELFPATQPIHHQLCTDEVSSFGTERARAVMKGIAAEQDKDLERAIEEMARGNERSKNTWNNYDNSRGNMQMDHMENSGSMTFHF